MKTLNIILIIFIFISCNSNQDKYSPKIKILPQKEADKILNNQKNAKEEKPKLREKKVENKIIIKTPKGKQLEITGTAYKKLEENLKKKEATEKEKEKIKTTLDDLEFLEYKKNVIEKLTKDNDFAKGSSQQAKIHISDKLRALFKPIVNKYSMRHLSFESDGDRVILTTISLRYENEKKRIEFEITDLDMKFIKLIKKGQKDFYYKNYKLDNFTVHLSINYKFKLVNAAFNNLGYTWIITAQNIDDINDILDIIRNINFNVFMELKAKYEEE